MTHANPSRMKNIPGNFDRLNLFYTPKTTQLGFPIIEAYHGTMPDRLVPFRYRHPQKNDAIHFFLDDFRFECVWNRPTHYAQWYSGGIVLSPDFSVNYDYNINIQRWNHYRSQWLGAYMNSMGVNIIPTVTWSTPETFDFCFDGIQGGIVAIASHGIHQVENIINFSEGVSELIKRVQPTTILCAGKFNNKYIGSLGKIEVIEYSNDFKSHTYIK